MKPFRFAQAIVLVGLAALPVAARADETVRVGLGLPLSGGVAFIGNRYLKGWEAGLADVNAKGGINGKPLEIVVRDQKSLPSEAVAVAKRLVELDHVAVLDITQPTSATLATKSIALETRTPMITGTAYLPGAVDRANPFFFRVGVNNDLVSAATAALIKKLDKKRIAVLTVNEDYGRGLVDTIKASQAAGRYDVVFADFYDRAQTDFSAILLKMRAAQPDVYFIDVRYPQSVTALKQMAELGMKAPKIGGIQLFNADLMHRVGKALDDTYVVLGWATMVKDPESDAFQAAYRARNSDEPDDFAADGWTVAHVVADALRRAGPNASGEQIRDAIATTRIDSPKGPVRFNDTNDSPVSMRVLRFNDGAWTIFPLD